jgi:hypothetical protein
MRAAIATSATVAVLLLGSGALAQAPAEPAPSPATTVEVPIGVIPKAAPAPAPMPPAAAPNPTAPAAVPTPAPGSAQPAASAPRTQAQLGVALFNLLLEDGPAESIAITVEDIMILRGLDCKQVSAYQLAGFSTGERRLRVKCPQRPVYGVTVTDKGAVTFSGGDGTIPALQSTNGPVVEIFGQRADRYLRQQAALAPRPVAPAREIPSAAAPERASAGQKTIFGLPGWALVAIGLNLILIAVIGLIVLRIFGNLRTLDQGARRELDRFLSRDKDEIMEECWEMFPNIYKHPRGFFLARGKHGKRRLFRSQMAAFLYRDFGLRLGEIG